MDKQELRHAKQILSQIESGEFKTRCVADSEIIVEAFKPLINEIKSHENKSNCVMKTSEEVLKAENPLISYDEYEVKNITRAMKEYARKKCKEQRKICAESGFSVKDGEYTFNEIENAPEPEFS